MNDVTGHIPGQPDAHDQLVHEFKNYLAVIVGFSEILLCELSPGDPRRGDIAQIHQAGQGAVALLPKLSPDKR